MKFPIAHREYLLKSADGKSNRTYTLHRDYNKVWVTVRSDHAHTPNPIIFSATLASASEAGRWMNHPSF